jgi:hypothetical protein
MGALLRAARPRRRGWVFFIVIFEEENAFLCFFGVVLRELVFAGRVGELLQDEQGFSGRIPRQRDGPPFSPRRETAKNGANSNQP